MNRFKKLVAVFAFSLMLLALPSIASAQWRDRDNDDNRNNGRYNRNSQYNRNLQGTIRSLKNLSNQFERQVDRELDRSRINETRREDRINDLAERFKEATDDLDDAYDDRGDYNRSADEARRVLALGSQIDRVISRRGIGRNVQNSWSAIQRQLRVLARTYNGSYNNRDNDDRRDDRRNDRRDNRRNFPF
jgi:hypothetical protein